MYKPDGEELEITTSMLLGHAVQQIELPKSGSERNDERIAYVKLAIGGVLLGLLLWLLSMG